MRIGVLGINHKSADLGLREHLAKACYKRFNIESGTAERLSCVLLLTCHRSEIYFSAEDLAAAHSVLLHELREEIPVPFEHRLYAYFGEDCFGHLAQVASGLDSMVIGESEIQRQVKLAYEQTCLHYTLPSTVHYLFQKSLQIGKFARSGLSLPKGQVTLPKIMHEICSHLFPAVSSQRLLFIGNSEINRKVITFFKHKGIRDVTLCTRSLISAREFAGKQQLQLLDWSQLEKWKEFDVVVCGTNASSFLIQREQRGIKTSLIFDLGVPRNVDPNLVRHPELHLFNIDQLGQMIENTQVKHVELHQRALGIVQEKVQRYAASLQDKEKRVSLCV